MWSIDTQETPSALTLRLQAIQASFDKASAQISWGPSHRLLHEAAGRERAGHRGRRLGCRCCGLLLLSIQEIQHIRDPLCELRVVTFSQETVVLHKRVLQDVRRSRPVFLDWVQAERGELAKVWAKVVLREPWWWLVHDALKQFDGQHGSWTRLAVCRVRKSAHRQLDNREAKAPHLTSHRVRPSFHPLWCHVRVGTDVRRRHGLLQLRAHPEIAQLDDAVGVDEDV
mmetsp:Transcript_30329/g.79588  ORF Transcript_30329/g.79588 Transcript_30329/m.79588 type:complete len:227 (-) Transcript_30329:490-1170(-)